MYVHVSKFWKNGLSKQPYISHTVIVFQGDITEVILAVKVKFLLKTNQLGYPCHNSLLVIYIMKGYT